MVVVQPADLGQRPVRRQHRFSSQTRVHTPTVLSMVLKCVRACISAACAEPTVYVYAKRFGPDSAADCESCLSLNGSPCGEPSPLPAT